MKLRDIRKSPLITDIWMRVLFLINIGLAGAIAFYTLFFIRPQDGAIPLSYSSLDGFDLARWYHVISFVVFAVFITGLNSYMAHTLITRTSEAEQPSFPWMSRLLLFNLFVLLMVLAIVRSIVRTL